ncbi:hypothetical protein SGRA_1213 [Saprospira grandis str. Lewin]|uniref:Uncharacterized protein n=1 Tax=Saprospira grandis (strain Lewin) TaxID=984262 RepID=H6L4M4_SAPGL|nr:hypothetical protein SGRA_1213 [Saprospira grandis str. Lewin]
MISHLEAFLLEGLFFLGPAAFGGRALAGLASLLGPSFFAALKTRSGLRPPFQAPRPIATAAFSRSKKGQLKSWPKT